MWVQLRESCIVAKDERVSEVYTRVVKGWRFCRSWLRWWTRPQGEANHREQEVEKKQEELSVEPEKKNNNIIIQPELRHQN